MSYGVLGWLSDLRELFSGIAGVLAPGGRCVLVEFHPFAMMLDDSGTQLKYPYMSMGVGIPNREGVTDYVGQRGAEALTPSGWQEGVRDFVNPETAWEFYWSLSDVVDALVGAGLRLQTMREWMWSNGWKPFDEMRSLGERRWAMPEGTPQLPLMFGLVATRG